VTFDRAVVQRVQRVGGLAQTVAGLAISVAGSWISTPFRAPSQYSPILTIASIDLA
jgi:hypothetical protein